ncbi:DUF5123 domain-containing protein [Carboxylicivirga caseinilyticus]|uniref:DUF5123 domain-containing protein n=1 Tax=Carboxylicivirga caseinilyticus TaxID=3417572 RepID=UPI003D357993|nr:DUF5123 domain-containing protein [Marinilabiliaceae bacterium A049]
MNKAFKYIGLMGIAALFALNACDDNIDPVIEELEYERIFTPLDLEARISNQTTVSLSWIDNKGVDSYVLEISDDSLEYSNIIHTAEILPEEIPYVYDLPAGDSQYSARVKGISSTNTDSKWATLAFKSLPENLFNNYDIVMTGLGELTISWTPGKAVTSLVFYTRAGVEVFSEDITAEEIAAGSKSLTDVANGDYTIQLMNGVKTRGFQDYVLEGTVLIDSGADLTAAITAASPGDVIMLQAGGQYGFIGDFTIDKSIKIKGLDGDLPVLYLTSGDRMFYVGSSLTPSDSLVFEKLHMNGYVDYIDGGSQIRGVFDMESEACNIGAVKFLSCELRNMGRQVMRLRGGSDQYVGEFVIDDCIINDLGRSSGSYGVFCATETNTNAGVVKITNSTLSNFVCHFIRYDDATLGKSIIVEDCTFNKVPFASGRYLMDVRNAVLSEGIEVTNCIFGNTSYGDEPSISGIRAADGVTVSVSNSFATTDFVNSGYSIVEMCSSTGGTSTELWVNPDNEDFSFITEGIEAGDPRWY